MNLHVKNKVLQLTGLCKWIITWTVGMRQKQDAAVMLMSRISLSKHACRFPRRRVSQKFGPSMAASQHILSSADFEQRRADLSSLSLLT